jgi:hypothetical protein
MADDDNDELMDEEVGGGGEEMPEDEWELDTLEMKVRARPDDFLAHTEYIAAIRAKAAQKTTTTTHHTSALHGRLRAAREALANKWPLPEEIWAEWLQDEMEPPAEEEEGAEKEGQTADDTLRHVEALARRALEDYLSVDIWLLLCDTVAMQLAVYGESLEGRARLRGTFEEAIAAGAGLHVIEGTKVWNAYRGTEKGAEDIARLFHRQLSVPLSGMEEVLASYEEWAEAHSVPEPQRDVTREAAAKAQAMLAARVPYE